MLENKVFVSTSLVVVAWYVLMFLLHVHLVKGNGVTGGHTRQSPKQSGR